MDNRNIEAFERLFGDKPSPTKEDADLLMDIYLDPDILEELQTSHPKIAERLNEFSEDAIVYIEMAEIPKTHKALLRNVAGLPEPRSDSHVPKTKTTIPPVKKPEAVADLSPISKPEPERPIYEPRKAISSLPTVVLATKPVEAKVFPTWSHTPQTIALLHSKDWHEFRKRVEKDFDEGSDLANWITYMTKYEKGLFGFL